MKKLIVDTLDKYLTIYKEDDKLSILKKFLNECDDEGVTDWNNFDGHVVASAFVMSRKEKLFALVYHNEFKIYVYPGGHITPDDTTPLQAAKREVEEETGLKNVEVISVCDDENVPFDIDTHHISYNEKLDLPAHYHFDYRYFFVVDNASDLVIDEEESSDYKWVPFEELAKNPHYGKCISKIEELMKKEG